MPSALINVMSAAAIKAGKSLLRDFGEVDKLQVSRKGTSNFVTSADKRTEKLLVAELKKARPDFGFLLEESGELPGKDPHHRWIVDPLDGTSNFIHAVPYFCISIALEKTEGTHHSILAGVIYDPIHNELFYAEKGRGAFLNDRRITASRRSAFDETMLVTGNPCYTDVTEARSFAMLEALTRSRACVRYTGATALDLAYLAAGRYDGGWYPRQQAWDVAAGVVLAAEAGVVITQINGDEYKPGCTTLLAANPDLHGPLRKLLAEAAQKN